MTDYGDILAGGKWLTDKHGIQRWVPNGPDVPTLACDFCKATTAEPCRTSAGTTRTPHAERIMRCLCGSNVEPGRTYCDDCQGVARRTAWRDSKRRKRVPAPATCPCGRELPKSKRPGAPVRYCSDACRTEGLRASWRASNERKRAS